MNAKKEWWRWPAEIVVACWSLLGVMYVTREVDGITQGVLILIGSMMVFAGITGWLKFEATSFHVLTFVGGVHVLSMLLYRLMMYVRRQ